MERIDHPTATDNDRFTDGNPAQAVPATVVTADWLNMIQEELANAVEGSGQELDETKNDQLKTAMLSRVELISSTTTITVGPTGDFPTLNAAIKDVSRRRAIHEIPSVRVTLNLQAGFVMQEQILVDGLDLSWITIAGDDAETSIDQSYLTRDIQGGNYPAFGVIKGGSLPVLGQLFRMTAGSSADQRHGVYVYDAGSFVSVLAGAGIADAVSFGLIAHSGATVDAAGAIFSNAGSYGVAAYGASTIYFDNGDASNAVDNGILAGPGSVVAASGANVSGSGLGVYAYYTGTVAFVGGDASNCGTGILATDSSLVQALTAIVTGCSTWGIRAEAASTINAYQADASSAGSIGISAISGSTINAQLAKVQNMTSGPSAVEASGGSIISITGIDTAGTTIPITNIMPNTLVAGSGIIFQ